MFFIIGLGNPGASYQATRHNIGWQVVDRAAQVWRVSMRVDRWVRSGVSKVQSVDVILAEPLTWMNQTGPVVHRFLDTYGGLPGQVLVVHDDLDLPLGRLRFRPGGGAGGHRGVTSLIAALGTDRFNRLKMGIGRPPEGVDPAAYVLSPFGSEEHERLQGVLDLAVDGLACVVTRGITAAMNHYNARTGNG